MEYVQIFKGGIVSGSPQKPTVTTQPAGRCGLAEPVAIATGSLRLVGGCDPGVVVEVVS